MKHLQPRPLQIGTRVLRAAGAQVGAPLGPHGERAGSVPIFQTANFEYPSAVAAEAATAGNAYFYSRLGNPTVHALEGALADLEGAAGCVAFASGMAAMAAAALSVGAGGEILLSEGIYGGTTELLREFGPRWGLHTQTVPGWDTEAVARAITPRTRAVLVETLSNPLLRVTDVPALGALCAERGLALIVDATFTSPCLSQPLTTGATLVVHSLSKYIAGHGDVIGGAVCGDGERLALVRHERAVLGGILDPFAAWLTLRGLRTLPLRMERQCATAARLAQALSDRPGVIKVFYPMRADHPDRARAQRLFRLDGVPQGGAVVSFELREASAARSFYDGVKVIKRAASLGEVESLLTHPASFSHRGLSVEERTRTGITEGLLRLSVGIEGFDDLWDDIVQALP